MLGYLIKQKAWKKKERKTKKDSNIIDIIKKTTAKVTHSFLEEQELGCT